MYTIKAIYDGTNFKPMQPIPVKEDCEVLITFLEPVKMNTADINKNEYESSIYLIKPDTSKTPVLGRLNGLIKIPADFDEPMEEMKEYMW